MNYKKNVLDLLDEIRAIGQLGINYTADPYDLQRYSRLMEMASNQYGDISGLPSTEVKSRFAKELGYITPKIGVQGALFNETGKILLERRRDDLLWGLPSGWVEVGETPEMSLKREFLEETNLSVEAVKLIGLYTRLPGQYHQPHTSVHILYLCKYTAGELNKSFESEEVRFCDYQQIDTWHKDHKQQVVEAISHWHM